MNAAPLIVVFGLGGWEVVGNFALILILLGAKYLPTMAKGLGEGILNFKRASGEVCSELGEFGEFKNLLKEFSMNSNATLAFINPTIGALHVRAIP